MKTPEVTKEEFLEAIKEGVYQAIKDCAGDYFHEAMVKGISEGIIDSTPSLQAQFDAIKEGIIHAMPHSLEILDTIEKAIAK